MVSRFPQSRPVDPAPAVSPDVVEIVTLPGGVVLPALPPLIGRQDDLTTLAGWLADPHTRLMTITGPGGVGKTSLAAEVVRSAGLRTPVRVETIPLATIAEPGLIPATIGRALGGTTPDAPALVALLGRLTRGATLLLVLDNFEHLLDGALLIGDLLAGCPGLRIVVTSRERLRLRGEREYCLEPLAPPPAEPGLPTTLDQAAASPAVRLFVTRANEVRSGFRLGPDNAADIGELCRRLDGLPLALELAAARLRSLPLPYLVARLDDSLALLDRAARDQVDRHRTLTAVAAWSYALLTPTEQRTFRRLALLPGPFPLSAALAVRGTDPAATGRADDRVDLTMLDLLASLVDKSLLNPSPPPDTNTGEPWYTMLETLRQFGLEQLRASGEDGTTREHHARWLLDMVTTHCSAAPTATIDPSQFTFCGAHLPAIRATLAWLEAAGDLPSLVRLISRIEPFWMVRSYRTEGIAWCRRLLGHERFAELPAVDRASSWFVAADLARTQALLPLATRCATSALTDYTAAGNTIGIVAAENLLGVIARTAGDFPRARDHAERATVLATAVDDPAWCALARCNLAAILIETDELDEAQQLLSDTDHPDTEQINRWSSGTTLVNLAGLARRQGRFGDAVTHYRRAIEAFRPIQPRESLLDVVHGIAVVAADCGFPADALCLLTAIDVNRSLIAYHLEAAREAAATQIRHQVRATLSADAASRAIVAGEHLAFAPLLVEAETLLDRIAARLGRNGASDVAVAPVRSLAARYGLTSREIEVLILLVEAVPDREIAERLFISPRTAMRHVANILAKLGVNSRTAAATLYLRDRIGSSEGREPRP